VADPFAKTLEFECDAGNSEKNWKRHRVSIPECEQVFFNKPLAVRPDSDHSSKEVRFFAFGKTDSGRRLAVVFMMRSGRFRVVTARDQSRRERRTYESYEKEDPEVQK